MLTSMLEKAIEIEGLLRIIRDGKPLPETFILLNIKAAELAEQAAALEDKGDTAQPEIPHADFVMTDPSTAARNIPEVVFSVGPEASTLPNADPAAETSTETREIMDDMPDLPLEDLALIEEDDIQLTFDDAIDISQPVILSEQPLEPTDTSMLPDLVVKTEFIVKHDLPDKHDLPEEDSVIIHQNIEEDDIDYPQVSEERTEGIAEGNEERKEDDNAHPSEAPAKPEAPAHAAAPKRNMKLRSAFSLNDRFLYARELFGGNMKMFDSTLDFIDGIDDYSIIEDYFYSELEWDPENTNVSAFMEILRPHFRE